MSGTGRSEAPGPLAPAPRAGAGGIWPLIPILALAGCSPEGQGGRGDVLTIGAYSVVREVLHEAILPAFAARWKAETGRDVRFEESYNGSGAQSRAIASGFDADIALLSLEDDVTPLVKAGLVSESWNQGPGRGVVTRSLVVVAVRPGNPKKIDDWADLAEPGVGVLYPDPKTSGGARWNINAIYGAGLLGDDKGAGKPDVEAARRLLAAVQANVINMDSSGRQSLATFERGIGDAAVTYENELRLRLSRGGDGAGLESIIPPRTLLIEGPAALVDASVERHGNRRLAEAFLAFLSGKEGQAILADYGFRPLDEPPPPGTFTMADLGGWSKVKAEVYGPKGLWTSIFTGRGKAGGGSRR